MDDEKRVAELSVDFAEAVRKTLIKPETLTRLIENVPAMQRQMELYKLHHLHPKIKETESSDELYKHVIAYADIMANIAANAMTKTEIARLMPPQLRRPDYIKILEKHNAAHVLELCRP